MEPTAEFTLTIREAIRAGLHDIAQARRLIAKLHDQGATPQRLQTLLECLSQAADPDCALQAFTFLTSDMAMRGADLATMTASDDHLGRLIRVLGASDALGKLMRFRPSLVEAAAADPHRYAEMTREQRIANLQGVIAAHTTYADAASALRARYREHLAAIMADDTSADDPAAIQPLISRRLSDLADAALAAALHVAQQYTPQADRVRFTIIGMGKLGARELNYVSDVDLIYVVEPVDEPTPLDGEQLIRTGTAIATAMQRVCQSTISGVAEPILWQIDGALRPEGRDGALVRRLESHRAYYDQWAQNWEFQALLKARPVAGDTALGDEYMAMTRHFVWSAASRPGFVRDCQTMRERVEQLIPAPLVDREIKLGRGGLRDVEFTVQMLQLVHGRSDTTLRAAATLTALQALAEGGYVSRVQAQNMADDYRFERVLEHRQQMWELKRTHLFPDLGQGSIGGLDRPRDVSGLEPDRNEELVRLARSVHMLPDELIRQYDATRREVRHLHNDIYYRPMLPISAQDDAANMSEQALADRYESIGFADPQAALRHVDALTAGVTRAARINRILLPAVLRWLGDGQNPDMGLLYWRKLAEHFGSTHEYLGFLRDSPSAGQRLCHVLSNSRYLGEALNKSLESITWLGNDELLEPRSRTSLDIQCTAITHRYTQAAKECANALRALNRHESERIGLGWMNTVTTTSQLMTGLTDTFDAIIDAALSWAIHETMRANNLQQPNAQLAVIAMGRYGGREVNFSSDADAIVIYRASNQADDTQAAAFARQCLDTTRRILQGPLSLEPSIDLDLNLRPEGRNGPLVRSYASCEQYYASWSSPWEHQALLRARYAAGNRALADDFLTHIANPLRYPASAPDDAALSEIRRLKARMEAERLPRGVERARHLKLGRGGLSDVEWTVQLLQLQHAGMDENLRVTGTMDALDALEEDGLVDTADASALRDAWQACTKARNANFLWSGRVAQADVLPRDWFALGGIGVYLGYDANHGQQFENDVMALMRRSRDVMERLFYGR